MAPYHYGRNDVSIASANTVEQKTIRASLPIAAGVGGWPIRFGIESMGRNRVLLRRIRRSIVAPSMRYHYQGGNITGDEVMATSGLEAGDRSCGGIKHGLHRVDNSYG